MVIFELYEKHNGFVLGPVFQTASTNLELSDEILKADSHEWLAEEKADGERLQIVGNYTDTDILDIRAYSRNFIERTINIPHIINLLKEKVRKPFILDMEITGKDCKSASGIMRLLNQDQIIAVQEKNGYLTARPFDMLWFADSPLFSQPLSYRLESLKIFLDSSGLNGSPYIKRLPQAITDKSQLLKDIWKMGGEGIILKFLASSYVEGRSKGWLKVKREKLYSVVIMGYTTGTGKYVNQIGAITFGVHIHGRLVEIGQCSGFTDSLRKDMTENFKNYQNRVIDVMGQELMPETNAIRHPRFKRFRDDKEPIECTLESLRNE